MNNLGLNSVKCGPEILVGVFLGTGFLTKLRFLGVVGLPEILAGIFLIFAIFRYGKSSLQFNFSSYALCKILFLISIFILLPLNTFYTKYALQLNVSIRDIFIYFACALFGVLFLEIQNGLFKFEMMTKTIAITFCVTIFCLVLILPKEFLYFENIRFTAGASNPNQFSLYCLCLMLLASIYLNSLHFNIIFTTCLVLGWYTFSYAFLLAGLLMGLLYLIFKYSDIQNRKYKFTIIIFVLLLAGFLFYNSFVSTLFNFLSNSNDISVRLDLLKNSAKVLIDQPFLGLGAGYFSGIENPYQGMEAHNTFLDFAIVFGLPFAVFIYAILFTFLYQSFWKNNKFIVITTVGLIVFSFFHFIGRHFIFWIILSIMAYEILYKSRTSNNNENLVSN